MQNSTYRERDYAQENEDGVYGSNIGILLQHLGSSRKPQLHLITHLSHIGHAVEAIEAGESRQGSGIQHVSWVFAELDIARKMSRQADVTMDDPLGTLELVETSIVAYGRGMENSGVNRGDDIRIANMCRAPGTEVAEGMECLDREMPITKRPTPIAPGDGKGACKSCGSSLSNLDLLNRHMMDTHDDASLFTYRDDDCSYVGPHSYLR